MASRAYPVSRSPKGVDAGARAAAMGTIQNNLGVALRALGEREGTTAKLEEAVVAYREALKEWTRGRGPFQWAATQNNLGNAAELSEGREGNPGQTSGKAGAPHKGMSDRDVQTVRKVAESGCQRVNVRLALHSPLTYDADMLQRLRPSGFVEPCLPSPADQPPTGSGWMHEIKHDGFRLMRGATRSASACSRELGLRWAKPGRRRPFVFQLHDAASLQPRPAPPTL
jgi:hypothetical protein